MKLTESFVGFHGVTKALIIGVILIVAAGPVIESLEAAQNKGRFAGKFAGKYKGSARGTIISIPGGPMPVAPVKASFRIKKGKSQRQVLGGPPGSDLNTHFGTGTPVIGRFTKVNFRRNGKKASFKGKGKADYQAPSADAKVTLVKGNATARGRKIAASGNFIFNHMPGIGITIRTAGKGLKFNGKK